MLTIILGTALAILFLLFSKENKIRESKLLRAMIAGIIFVVAVFSGMWGPLSGYTEWEKVNEVSLLDIPEYTMFREIDIQENEGSGELVVIKYQRKANASKWTFAFDTTETKYVIYVPEGTNLKE